MYSLLEISENEMVEISFAMGHHDYEVNLYDANYLISEFNDQIVSVSLAKSQSSGGSLNLEVQLNKGFYYVEIMMTSYDKNYKNAEYTLSMTSTPVSTQVGDISTNGYAVWTSDFISLSKLPIGSKVLSLNHQRIITN